MSREEPDGPLSLFGGTSPEYPDDAVRVQARRRTRRSFLAGGVGAAGLYGAWRWILGRPEIGQVPAPLRHALDFNADISHTVFGDRGLAPTFPLSRSVAAVRVNGVIGLDPALRLDRWRLQVKNLANAQSSPHYVADVNTWKYADDPSIMAQDDSLDTYVEGDGNPDRSNSQPNGPEPGLLLTMDAIRALPHVEMVTQLKCIEGWSEDVHWGGARLSDFIHAYPPACGAHGRLPRYVGLETPDRQYLRRAAHGRCHAPADPALLRNQWAAALHRSWRAFAAGHAAQVWHQASEADRQHQLQRHAATRLLGGE